MRTKYYLIFAIFILAILLAFFTFSGCGEDGQPGQAYISFTWDWYVDSYDDSNSDTPSWISEYQDYNTSSGTYSYRYDCSDGIGNFWYWYGTYTIYKNPGEEASWFSDGEDGADNRFRFGLYGSGPDFYLMKPDINKVKLESLTESNIDMSKYNAIPVGEEIKETIYSTNNRYKMEITRQRYNLELK